ncbi:MAG: ABC transporter permease [Alphaproteobacteria bacterium]|nr:ABC transporter permease [Alphaproteobacteria bacterium]
MGRYILQRLLQAVPILALVSLISFSVMHLVPGDPATIIGGPSATPMELQAIRENLGLDKPFHVQLLRFYGNALQGDLGRSLLLGKPVLEATIERLPVSLSIAGYALILTLFFGIMTGVIAALRQNTWVDQAAMTFALLGVSIPNFWLALMMIVLFAVHLGWLPSGGYVPWQTDLWGWFRSTTLAAVSLAMLQMGLLARITRSTMLEVLRQDYIRTAKAKGLPRRLVVGKHAMANVMIPVVTIIGIILSVLVSGSVVIEAIFSIPGIGSLLVNGILRRDYPMIQGGLLFVAAALMLSNIVVDVLYAYLDPRVRYDRDK